jgi:hypothetical protein
MQASAARNIDMNSALNTGVQGGLGKALAREKSAGERPAPEKPTSEKPRGYNPDELNKVIGKRKGIGLGAGLEYRQFVSKYRHTASGDKCKAQLRTEAFLNPGGPRAHRPKRGSRLKTMQNRNFVVSFFQNLVFIPTQAIHRLFAA